MILFKEDSNSAMRFEGLARFAFNNCGKFGDPWGYAAQDMFSEFVPTPSIAGKRALSTILIKLIIDNSDKYQIEKLKSLENSVWSSKTQEEIIEIIDKAIQIVE